LFAIPLWLVDTQIYNILIYTFLYAFYASSWSIIGIYAGQISIGHAAYFGVGAYTSILLSIHFNITPWLGMFVGGLFGAILAFLTGLICFRLGGLFYIFVTLSFAEIVRIIMLHPLRGLSGGEEGIPFSLGYNSLYHLQFVEKWPYYLLTLFMMLIMVPILKKIGNSKFGYCLKAIGEDKEAAESIGIDSYKYKLIAACISGFFSAIGGAVYVNFLNYIGVSDVFNVMMSITPIIISFIGGPGPFGPIIGSFILTPITIYLVLMLGGAARGIHNIVYALILIIIVMFFPEGIKEPLQKKVYNPIRKRLLLAKLSK
jgi:branched-chain amino acid transport system permease protein